MDFAHTFSKNYRFFFLYFLIKIIHSTLKIYSFGQKLHSKHFVQGKMQKVS